jgi:hypothetical protein
MERRSATDFDAVVEQTNQALIAFVQGDSSAIKSLFTRGDDVVLANPLGPPSRGRRDFEEGTDRAVAFLRDGTVEFEEMARHATSDLATYSTSNESWLKSVKVTNRGGSHCASRWSIAVRTTAGRLFFARQTQS